MAQIKTTVNKAKCIASEDCIQTAPGVFQLDDEGKSEVYEQRGAPVMASRATSTCFGPETSATA